MPSKAILALKDRYQNGDDNIGRDLIAPCLSEASLYRRGTGFFSSSALKAYAAAMDHIINEKVKLQIICSPIIQDEAVIRQLEGMLTHAARAEKLQSASENIVLTAVGYKLDPERRDYRQKLLAFLISSGQLEFRFAIPKGISWSDFSKTSTDHNLYHVKNGYFRFDDGAMVAFDGSFNESDSGHRHHIDRTQVYRSWVAEDRTRLVNLIEDVDNDWEERNRHIEVFRLGKDALDLIRRLSPSGRPRPPRAPPFLPTKPAHASPPLWPHQENAVSKFLEAKRGILEMATGTGKTRTALEIMRRLLAQRSVETIVICTYGTDLLNQWVHNLNPWFDQAPDIPALSLFKMYDTNNELQAFLNAPKLSVLVISREPARLRRLLSSSKPNWSRTLIVHDEIHGFASPEIIANLGGLHSPIRYRLGLSATPDREYDEQGNNFTQQEVGPVIFEYPLEQAIRDGILCEFDYEVIPFSLLEEDHERRRAVYSRYAASKHEGAPWTQERLFTELSKIIKAAVEKPERFGVWLAATPSKIKHSIVFVLDRAQGASFCEVISRYTIRYKSYYSGTGSAYIDELSAGRIDCLVACQRLNEGVDIKKLRTVFLVSSDRTKLDTIQRIGRCLRKDPSDPAKRALVVDFVLSEDKDAESPEQPEEEGESRKREPTADQRRMEWLQGVAEARYEERQT